MKDIDKRVQTLEQEDADDEGDGGLDKKRLRKESAKPMDHPKMFG